METVMNIHRFLSSSDALPLSYRRLVGAKGIKLGSCGKRLALQGLECRSVVNVKEM